MNEKICQMPGLGGFIVAIDVRDGDWLVIVASMVWNASCLAWLLAHLQKVRA